MNIENQKLMALEGIHTWARGVLSQVSQMERARASYGEGDHVNARREFERARHMFLISSNRLLEYVDWAVGLKFLDGGQFAELTAFRSDIKYLRNKNEHVVEYFSGKEPEPPKWWHAGPCGEADASSTSGSKIGGRLDWKDVAAACEKLIAVLPAFYAAK